MCMSSLCPIHSSIMRSTLGNNLDYKIELQFELKFIEALAN